MSVHGCPANLLIRHNEPSEGKIKREAVSVCLTGRRKVFRRWCIINHSCVHSYKHACFM
uniref:Uncharacterized protein n=1 Tax=Anguilla anguilla TaxID=7936 RepID=A0A0E9UJC3_ANGAN